MQLSRDREVLYGAALALALSGDSFRARNITDDLDRRFPEDTSVRSSYVPVLRSSLAMNQGQALKALELLQIAVPYELGTHRSSIHGNFGALYPVYMRGQAYLAAHQGEEAAVEFQKILDHRGVVVSDTVGALAHLQLGRAYVMQGNKAKAKTAYESFLALWKDADAEMPVLARAKSEYASLD
jgi:predicted Zn-dependent protease